MAPVPSIIGGVSGFIPGGQIQDMSTAPPTHRVSDRRRVLIVDDEALIRWALAETLADEGFAVEQAGSKREVLDMMDGHDPFDVVVLDFRLPDSDDLQLLSRLRARMPATPIIMMTAFATPDMVQGALDLGAFRVVSKPFEITEMAALVKRAH
jgi:two-component system nitrogen regulation response regulator GlnG